MMKNKILFVSTGKVLLSCLLISLTGLFACNKEGELRKAPAITVLGVQFSSPNTELKYSAWLDGKQIGDSLMAGTQFTKKVEKEADKQQLTIKSLEGEILIDTTVQLSTPAANFIYLDLGDARPQFLEKGQQTIDKDSCQIGLLISTAKINEPVDIELYCYDYLSNTINRTPVYTFKQVIPGQLSGFGTVLYNTPEIQYVMTVKYSRNGELIPGLKNNALIDGDLYLNNLLTLCRSGGNDSNVAFIVKLLEDSNYFYTSCVAEL